MEPARIDAHWKSTNVVTYDSADFKTQLRCLMRPKYSPGSIFPLVLFPALLLILRCPVQGAMMILAGLLVIFTLPPLLVAAMRSTKPRFCRTSISATGVHDITPDSNAIITWKEIRSIEVSKAGDIHFCGIIRGAFIPASAFAGKLEATDFANRARGLWQRYSDEPVRLDQHSNCPTCGSQLKFDDPLPTASAVPSIEHPRIEDVSDAEEDAWKELERRHAELTKANPLASQGAIEPNSDIPDGQSDRS